MVNEATTAEELYQISDRDGVHELLRGVVQRRPLLGYDEGRLLGNLQFLLQSFVIKRQVGVVVGGRCGFLLAHRPDTVRAARIAYVRSNRSQVSAASGPFFPGAPDLAIEVISASDRAGEIEEKVRDWLTHGGRVVWLVNPIAKLVTVYRGPTVVQVFTAADTLVEPELLPGFELPVLQIFERPA